MKAKGYKFAVEWIALNDSPGDVSSAEELAGLVSVALVADLYGKDQSKVGADVFRLRQRHGFSDKSEGRG